MKTLTLKSANLFTHGSCTGNCAEIDFHRNGVIDITFGIFSNKITAVDYCGVSFNLSPSTEYWFNPSTKSVKSNETFFNRLIAPLEDSTEKTYLLSLMNR